MKSALLYLAAMGASGASAIVLPAGYSGPSSPLALPKFSGFNARATSDGQGFSMPLHRTLKRDLNDAAQTSSHMLLESEKLRLKYGNFTVQQKREATLEKRQTIGLTDYSTDSSYYAQVSIGTPQQNFLVVLDTGSSDFWIMDTSCGKACDGSPKFDFGASSTYKSSTTPFEIQYGLGATQGTLAADTVSLAGYVVQSQTFAIADALADGTLQAPASGIMGMGFEGLATSGATPFWEVLAQSGRIPSPVFTFQLARQNNNPQVLNAQTLEDLLTPGGVFTLGTIDQNQYSGSITYTDVTSPLYWTIPLTAISINGQNNNVPSSSQPAAIDTGTTLIAGPFSLIREIYAQIPQAQQVRMGDGSNTYYAFPCRTSVSISLTFGGKAWSINPSDFNYGLYGTQGGTQFCLGAFFGASLGTNAPAWIIGDAFLKNVFSIYDANFGNGNARVGFASLVGSSAQTASTTLGAINISGSQTRAPVASSSVVVTEGQSANPLPTNSITGIVGGSGLPAPTPGTQTATGASPSLTPGSSSGGSSGGSGSPSGASKSTVAASLLTFVVAGVAAGCAIML